MILDRNAKGLTKSHKNIELTNHEQAKGREDVTSFKFSFVPYLFGAVHFRNMNKIGNFEIENFNQFSTTV